MQQAASGWHKSNPARSAGTEVGGRPTTWFGFRGLANTDTKKPRTMRGFRYRDGDMFEVKP